MRKSPTVLCWHQIADRAPLCIIILWNRILFLFYAISRVEIKCHWREQIFSPGGIEMSDAIGLVLSIAYILNMILYDTV